MATDFLIILALMFANGLFAGAEIAVLSVRKTRLAELQKRGDKRALAVQSLREQPERFLATVQIGITLVSTAAAAFGGAAIGDALETVLQELGFGSYSKSVAIGTVVVLISFLSVVFGELIPKSLALRYSDLYALFIGRPLLGLARLARPIVWVLTASSNLFLRLFGDSTNFAESRLSRDELQQLVEEAAVVGSVDPRASEIASRALEFGEVTVAELMVPRVRVVALAKTTPSYEARRILLEEGHSRMPVFGDSPDHLIGYVVARDVVSLTLDSGLVVFDDIIRPLAGVHETARAVDVLRDMQRKRTQMSAVLDDDGMAVGIITIEDLVEDLIGDIFSEDEEPEEIVEREASGAAVVAGWVAVRKVNRELDIALPVGRDRTTIAGLCMGLSGAIPSAGERIVVGDGSVIEILESSPRRVRKVRIWPSGLEAVDPLRVASASEVAP